MAISLYTSRVILQTLGIEDYGIYNLVGGVVVLFSFLNNAMINATQRFLNIEIPTKDKKNINKVFSVSLNIHVVISILILLLSETIGLWFLNNKLNIPTDRFYAANIVYQFSIVTTIVNIMRVPDNATILAHERMSFYAILGICETILKLIIVYLLVFFKEYDHLIIYSFLVLIVNLIINFTYSMYNRINFREETKFKLYKDKALFKRLLSFSGWSIFGQVAVLGSTQGLNMILNIFIGVTVNAALGISNQVNAAIYNFIANMQVAFNPQIIQTYAENNYIKHKSLVLNASKYSVYLFLILALPFLLQTEYILKLWLGPNLPQYVISFTQIVIIGSIINAIVGPFWMSANAIGNIRTYQLIISLILLLNLPIAYLLLKNGYSPIFVMSTKVILNLVALIYRFYYVNQKLRFAKHQIFKYLKELFIVFIFIVFLIITVNTTVKSDDLFFILSSIVLSEIILFAAILLFGVSKNERINVYKVLLRKIKKEIKK
ncbi:MATE family efflux transporter [Sphingobacterium cellulitidis]|uniref:Na+-driven multidrug efflux pump n=1 Tax=Sphingobacterium cellulitidis TaxID=1768011 RepID=A0A8H9G0P9_9SPHI|nr:polysaccharide biosynthesis protein [Sphingobacterium soli]MBA8987580.1 O-antigen/teichoic acid export membrane protein [Sphingobacterium soli]GGE23822.1 hypothetical protein GCM10011516_21870 [Sphingobacterium soli]